MYTMTRPQRIKIAGHVGCDPRTVSRWIKDPASVLPVIAGAIEEACRKLKIDNPHAG